MNFPRKFTFISLHRHPPRSKPKLQKLHCLISVQSPRFPGTSCPGTSSTWAPPALPAWLSYCFQRAAPLLSPASPSRLPWEVYSTAKKFSLPHMSFWVDPVLSQLPTAPESSGGRRTRDLPARREGGRGHPLGSGLVAVVKLRRKFSGCQIRDLSMGS